MIIKIVNRCFICFQFKKKKKKERITKDYLVKTVGNQRVLYSQKFNKGVGE